MKVEFVEFQTLGDERGSLVVMEQFKNIPWEIKRVYYLIDTKEDVRRGFHAHKNLKQIAIPVTGTCKFLLDNGESKSEVLLKDSSQGLVIHPNVWHEMYDFSKDCVLLVLADDFYDESDYIRNYDDFISHIINIKG